MEAAEGTPSLFLHFLPLSLPGRLTPAYRIGGVGSISGTGSCLPHPHVTHFGSLQYVQVPLPFYFSCVLTIAFQTHQKALGKPPARRLQ